MTNSTRTEKRNQHPIDTGWAWCVLTASIVSYLIYGGVHRGFGVLFVEFRSVFGSSSAAMSTVVSIQIAVMSLSGMFVMAFGMRFLSSRQCVIIAGFLCVTSLILSSLAKSVLHLIFTHSILIGIAFSFQVGPTIIVIGRYFDKRRGIANSFFQASASLGGLLFAPVFRYFIDTYLLQGALLLVAGLACHIIPLGLLLRPPELYERWAKERKHVTDECLLENVLKVPCRPRSATSESLTYSGPKQVTLQRQENGKINSYSVSLNELHSNNSEKEFHQRKNNLSENSMILRKDIYGSSEIIMVVPYGSDSNRTLRNPEVNCETEDGSSDSLHCLNQFFNVKIFKNLSYDFFAVGFTLGVSVVATVVYIPDIAKDNGIHKEQAALLVSIYMVGEIIGRSFSGFCSGKVINRQTVIGISLLIAGIIQNLVRYCTTYWSLIFFAFSNGLFGGPIHGLYASITADILGIEDLRSGMCVLQLTQGIAWCCVLPIAGYIRDISDSYIISYHFVGGLAVIAALILLLSRYFVDCFDVSNVKNGKQKDVQGDNSNS